MLSGCNIDELVLGCITTLRGHEFTAKRNLINLYIPKVNIVQVALSFEILSRQRKMCGVTPRKWYTRQG